MDLSVNLSNSNVTAPKGTFSSMLPWREYSSRLVNISNRVAHDMEDYRFKQSQSKTVRNDSGRLTNFDGYA